MPPPLHRPKTHGTPCGPDLSEILEESQEGCVKPLAGVLAISTGVEASVYQLEDTKDTSCQVPVNSFLALSTAA